MPQAVSAQEMAKEQQIDPRVQGARDEKVMVVPDEGKFVVVPAYKVVSPGQTLTFRAFGCDKLDIEKLDPKAFEVPKNLAPTTVTVQVKQGTNGVYPYEAFCETKGRRKRARGYSPPGVIIDGAGTGGTG